MSGDGASMHSASPTPRRADLSAWLKDRFVPCWAGRVLLPGRAGYGEDFRYTDGAPCLPIAHTTMVTGRLVYSFSLAYRLDRAPASLRAAEHGLAFLLDRCRLSPGHYAHRIGGDGEMPDTGADLYDLAFVLLALGGYSAATGETRVLAAAHEIATRLDGELTDPAGGYREPAGPAPARLQYPQMHLFEAFQMLAAADPSGGWDRRAERIVDLVARLVDADGALDEWFGAGWEVLEPVRRLREIGHHFEWAWLLFAHATTTGSTRAAEIGRRLFDFGLRTALVADGAATAAAWPERPIPNAVDLAGRPVGSTRPLWPTIELAKASLARAAMDGNPDDHARAARAVDVVLSRMDGDTGTWRNSEAGDGAKPDEITPARTLYHLLPCLLLFARHETSAGGTRAPSMLRPF